MYYWVSGLFSCYLAYVRSHRCTYLSIDLPLCSLREDKNHVWCWTDSAYTLYNQVNVNATSISDLDLNSQVLVVLRSYMV